MNRATWKFLKRCEKYKLRRVCIGVRHSIVPESLEFIRDAGDIVFGISTPKGDSDHEGWPAIWAVVADLGIDGGYGGENYDQANLEGLEKGVYRLSKGKWTRLIEECFS